MRRPKWIGALQSLAWEPDMFDQSDPGYLVKVKG